MTEARETNCSGWLGRATDSDARSPLATDSASLSWRASTSRIPWDKLQPFFGTHLTRGAAASSRVR